MKLKLWKLPTFLIVILAVFLVTMVVSLFLPLLGSNGSQVSGGVLGTTLSQGTATISTNDTNFSYGDVLFFNFSGFTPSSLVNVTLIYPGTTLMNGIASDVSGSGNGTFAMSASLPQYVGTATLIAIDNNSMLASLNLGLNLTAITTNFPQNFSYQSFRCLSINSGYNCSVGYTHSFNESIAMIFIVSSSKGYTLVTASYTAIPGTGYAQVSYFCRTPGNYYMSWEAYRSSDVSLKTPIAFSTPLEYQFLVC